MNINQAKLNRDIEEVYLKAGDLHSSLVMFIKKFNNIGLRIKQIAISYNDALGTLKGNLLPKGKRFSELTGKNIGFNLEDSINENDIRQIDK